MTKNWRRSLESTTRWLWDALMGPLHDALLDRHLDRAVLIPQGLLGSLPLHAAWREAPDSPAGRHSVLDVLVLSYAPNARALLTAHERAERASVETICAVENPDGSLHAAWREVASILRHFPPEGIRHLRGDQARKQAVLAGMAGAGVLHFATHGWALPLNPLQSGLLLAAGERLTLGDLLKSRLEGVRLAVLSACETGIQGIQIPDEAISLSTAFLQAGAAGAVGSLWRVEDRSTMLLMVRFYELWRGQGLPPAESLRQAQRWLRDLTEGALTSFFRSLELRDGHGEDGEHEDETTASTEALRDALDGRLAPSHQNRPFAHPLYWSAFYFTGV